MDELKRVVEKYDAAFVRQGLSSLDELKSFSARFYLDVGEIYDCITRIKNTERNPSGYSAHDAPMLGLLVRAWKLFKEVVRYYELDNMEIVAVLERPLLESVIMARYLMSQTPDVVDDYRKCSYKDRLRLLTDLREGTKFTKTNAGRRLALSVERKLAQEGLREDDFAQQEQRRWRLQGKSFRDIFRTVENDSLYSATYGMMSESIHGSWNDSMDHDLIRNEDGTFSANPFSHPADIRYVTPLLRFTNPAYRSWIIRIDATDTAVTSILDWIESVNSRIYARFDELFDDNDPAAADEQ